ncbi:MAG: hypothetical protein C0622_13400 [Desulfuromonas sp.]|nr:MAG: hypothetical protein C0622_13400 [Desulfuromonas sp.]
MTTPARQWITPITLGTFIVSAVTGGLLLFHVKIGFISWSHEWLSLAFVAGVIIHCLINFKPLKNFVTRPKGAVIVATFVLLTVFSTLPLVENGDHGDSHSPTGKMFTAMGNLPLATVAEATGHTQNEVVAILTANNIVITGETQTLAELAGQNHTRPAELVKLIL